MSTLIDNTGRQFLPIQYSLSGTAVPYQTSGPGESFSMSFLLDTSQSGQVLPQLFSTTASISNLIFSVNGQTQFDVPALNTYVFGEAPYGSPTVLDMGMNSTLFGMFFEGTRTDTTDLSTLLLSGNNVWAGGIGDQWNFSSTNLSVTSVPAPSDWLAVLLWLVVAAAALAFSTRDNV